MIKKVSLMILLTLFIGGLITQNVWAVKTDDINDRLIIRKIVHDITAWALKKDFKRLKEILIHEEDLFFFQQSSNETIVGWNQFTKLFKFWKDPDFKAISYDLRELRINISRSGDVAWCSAMLDDIIEWKGKQYNLTDIRWTGVLEKRNNKWVIVQMHYSFADDIIRKKVLTEKTVNKSNNIK